MPTASSSRSRYILHDTDILQQHAEGRVYVMRFRDGDDYGRSDHTTVQDRLAAIGVQQLSMSDLVALVMSVGAGDEGVMEMSQRVIREYGEKALIHETRPRVLAEALNIPYAKAAQLVACFEVGRRYFSRQAGRPIYVRRTKQAYEYLKSMGDLRKEELRGLYLNSRYQVVHDEVISIGSLTANIVHPREVFQPAIEHSAGAVIIAHNHPSGQLTPTLADIELTEQLVAAGKLLSIELLDHLIIIPGRYVSLLSPD